MYELKKVGSHTYYIESPTNVGIYEYGGKVCLIDSGNDKTAAKRILDIITAQGWTADMVICTHSHADHAGGCALIHERTGCRVFAPDTSAAIIRQPLFEPATLYGGYPPKELRSKFLMPAAARCEELCETVLPDGLSFERFDGHDFAQAAIRTDDGVWFLADIVISAETLEKYSVSFLFDIEEHLKSLDRLEQTEGRLFIPAHAKPTEDIAALCRANRENVREISAAIKELCAAPITAEELIERLCERYSIPMSLRQYVLIGSTVRSYLSWLCDSGEMQYATDGYKMTWQTVSTEINYQ